MGAAVEAPPGPTAAMGAGAPSMAVVVARISNSEVAVRRTFVVTSGGAVEC
jgi:hypothetical protein